MVYRLTLEVRYDDGIVYLDHCGSLSLALSRALGEPFKTRVSPNMDFGELVSPSENLVVRYGPENLVVDQYAPETPARFEKLAPIAWHEVAKSLDVAKKITRCGMRAWGVWSVDSLTEGHEALRRSGLVRPTERWTQVFGETAQRTFGARSSSLQGGRTRHANLDAVGLKLQGPSLVDKKFAPAFAVQLDLDFALESTELTKETLHAFLRSNLRDVSKISSELTAVLHADDSNDNPSE